MLIHWIINLWLWTVISCVPSCVLYFQRWFPNLLANGLSRKWVSLSLAMTEGSCEIWTQRVAGLHVKRSVPSSAWGLIPAQTATATFTRSTAWATDWLWMLHMRTRSGIVQVRYLGAMFCWLLGVMFSVVYLGNITNLILPLLCFIHRMYIFPQ